MTDIYFPDDVKVQGNDKAWLLTAVADPTAPKVATEIGATDTVEITLAAYGSWDAPVTVNTGNAPVRWGTVEQFPEEGNAQRQVIPLTYPCDPSKADSDVSNKLKSALSVQGTVLYVVVRRGVSHLTDAAAADIGLTYKVTAGFQPEPTRSSDDEFARYQIVQNLIPVETPVPCVFAA